MELLKMQEEYKKNNEKARKLHEEIITTLRIQFIDLPFKMQKIEFQVPENWIAEEKFHRIYCPVLDVPKGFCKENEKYERYGGYAFNHKYTLSDESGTKLEIKELANYSKTIFSNENGRIGLNDFVTYEKIEYTVKISDMAYKFVRDFKYEEMLQKILNKEIPTVKYKKLSYIGYYLAENERYKKFLATLGITGKVISLDEILKAECEEIELNSKILAKVKIEKEKSVRVDRLYDTIWDVYMNIPFMKNNVCIRIYSKAGQLVSEKNFSWYELVDKKYEEGITFREIIELLKK